MISDRCSKGQRLQLFISNIRETHGRDDLCGKKCFQKISIENCFFESNMNTSGKIYHIQFCFLNSQWKTVYLSILFSYLVYSDKLFPLFYGPSLIALFSKSTMVSWQVCKGHMFSFLISANCRTTAEFEFLSEADLKCLSKFRKYWNLLHFSFELWNWPLL